MELIICNIRNIEAVMEVFGYSYPSLPAVEWWNEVLAANDELSLEFRKDVQFDLSRMKALITLRDAYAKGRVYVAFEYFRDEIEKLQDSLYKRIEAETGINPRPEDEKDGDIWFAVPVDGGRPVLAPRSYSGDIFYIDHVDRDKARCTCSRTCAAAILNSLDSESQAMITTRHYNALYQVHGLSLPEAAEWYNRLVAAIEEEKAAVATPTGGILDRGHAREYYLQNGRWYYRTAEDDRRWFQQVNEIPDEVLCIHEENGGVTVSTGE